MRLLICSWPLLTAVAFCLGTTGCSSKPSLPPETDTNVAREAMTIALDAWKQGKTPDALKQGQPAVDFRDSHWEKGSKLTGYVVKAEEKSGLSVKFTVELKLQEKDGNTRERVVVYNVDAGQTVVIRPNF